jgi:hypothetical protein
VIPVVALVEAYAVLTSLPANHRLTHADAYHILQSSFATARLASHGARETWPMLRGWSVSAVGGAESWDGMLVEAARAAGARTLLTFRRRELERLGLQGLEILEPV